MSPPKSRSSIRSLPVSAPMAAELVAHLGVRGGRPRRTSGLDGLTFDGAGCVGSPTLVMHGSDPGWAASRCGCLSRRREPPVVSFSDRVKDWPHWLTLAALLSVAALGVVFFVRDVPSWAGSAAAFAVLSVVWAIDSLGDLGLHSVLRSSVEEVYVRLGRSVAPALAAALAIIAIIGGIAGAN